LGPAGFAAKKHSHGNMRPMLAPLQSPRILVVGAGALGGVVANALAHAGNDVTVLVRRAESARVIETAGLRELRSGFVTKPRVILEGMDAKHAVFDYVVLATQPTDVESVVSQWADRLGPNAQWVCLQNGLCDERVANLIGATRVIGAVVAFGAKSHGDAVCEWVPGGGLVVGRIDGVVDAPLTTLAECLKPLGKVRISKNLLGIRWSKLTVNCAISTLGTIGGDQLGPLLNQRFARELAFEIMGEAVQVARALGIRLERLPGTVPLPWLASSSTDTAAGVRAMAKRWAQHTAALGLGAKYRRLRSSMLRAIEKGHPPAVDYLNGEIVQHARRVGLVTPINQKACEFVWQIARGERPAAHATLRTLFDETR
jgi:2-dehydropantoate 2-reductase